jgi:hypothetical protein
VLVQMLWRRWWPWTRHLKLTNIVEDHQWPNNTLIASSNVSWKVVSNDMSSTRKKLNITQQIMNPVEMRRSDLLNVTKSCVLVVVV